MIIKAVIVSEDYLKKILSFFKNFVAAQKSFSLYLHSLFTKHVGLLALPIAIGRIEQPTKVELTILKSMLVC